VFEKTNPCSVTQNRNTSERRNAVWSPQLRCYAAQGGARSLAQVSAYQAQLASSLVAIAALTPRSVSHEILQVAPLGLRFLRSKIAQKMHGQIEVLEAELADFLPRAAIF
jgi:hypothetical protein